MEQSYVDLDGLRTFKINLEKNIRDIVIDTDTYATKDDLTDYVQKDGNKVLSTNDFTTADKTKLTNIDDSAQVNAIESVKVNNTKLDIVDKAVDIDLANASVKSAASLNSAKSLKVSLASSNAQSFDGSDNATVIGVGGILPTVYGGTGNANGTVSGAAQLNTAQNFITNLNSTVAGSFNGTTSVSAGVTGILPVANGGTGQTDLNNVTVGAAVHDNAGNVITDTYVTKTEFNHKVNAVRYGYRIKQSEADPDLRVEYIYDAAGMRPAHMVFDTDTSTAGTASDTSYFDYGDWQSVWFVRDNKPLMLKSDGTVDYYLDPNDYSKKENGDTDTDIANIDYDGNAMAQFPLVWVKRYTEGDYAYEIISNVQYDEDYKAYAHTDANGEIKDYFYHAIFGSSDGSSKFRSISGQSLASTFVVNTFLNRAAANGSNWFITSWSQFLLIRTLLILISKSTWFNLNFGNGNVIGLPSSVNNASVYRYFLPTGTLNDKGQFFGYNSINKQVKVFHVEGWNGDQSNTIAGFLYNKGSCYVKMSPPYSLTSTSGHTYVGSLNGRIGYGVITSYNCSELGIFPSAFSGGSSSTYYCDSIQTNPDVFVSWLAGGCVRFDRKITLNWGNAYNSAPVGAHLTYV